MVRQETPDVVPVLSRGKHRSPRKGACFMEYASYLAGERWSDHPACTHPLLAGVARAVNDNISDAGRSRLIGLVPSVIGLTSDDPVVDIGIAARCAATALPVVSLDRQRALAAGLLGAGRVLAELKTSTSVAVDVSEHVATALAQTPNATEWARQMFGDRLPDPRTFQRRSAPAIVRISVTGIAEAYIPGPDELLSELLTRVVGDCQRWLGEATATGHAGPSMEVCWSIGDILDQSQTGRGSAARISGG